MALDLAQAPFRAWLREDFLQAVENPGMHLYEERSRTVVFTRCIRHHSLLLLVLPEHPYMVEYLTWLDKQRRPKWDVLLHELIPEEQWESQSSLAVQTIFTHIQEHGCPPMDCLTLNMPM